MKRSSIPERRLVGPKFRTGGGDVDLHDGGRQDEKAVDESQLHHA